MRQVGEEARPVGVVLHVADRIEVDERRHRGDDDQHHRRQSVDPQRPVDLEVARNDERHDGLAGVLVAEADPRQNAIQDSTMEMNSSVVVMSSAVRDPAAGGSSLGVIAVRLASDAWIAAAPCRQSAP